MLMEWIPVSDKLPEIRGNYLVTVEMYISDMDYYHTYTCIDHYNGCGEWTKHHKKDDKVIAWMNLPDAYAKYEK